MSSSSTSHAQRDLHNLPPVPSPHLDVPSPHDDDSFMEITPPETLPANLHDPPIITTTTTTASSSSHAEQRNGGRLGNFIAQRKPKSLQNNDRSSMHPTPPTTSAGDGVFASGEVDGWLDGGLGGDVEIMVAGPTEKSKKETRKDKDRESITSRSGRSIRKKTSRLFSGHPKKSDGGELQNIDRRVSASSASTSSSSALSPSAYDEEPRGTQSNADLAPPSRLHRTHSASTSTSRHGEAVSRGGHVRSSLPPGNPLTIQRRRTSRDSDTSFLSIPPANADIKDRSSSSARGSDEGALHSVREDQEMYSEQRGGNAPNLSSRMSNWFTNMLPNGSQSASNVPGGSNTARSGGDSSRLPFVSSTGSSIPTTSFAPASSPGRKLPQVATNLLAAAKQKAAGGMRYLIDSEAQPDGCEDPIWVMGVAHAYTEPLEEDIALGRDLSPNTIADKRLLASSPSSQQQSGGRFTQLFSSSAGSESGNAFSPRKGGDRLTEPVNGSPSRPGKGKGREKSKESVSARKWPDGFIEDFHSIIWCTYRSQYAPITAMPPDRLLVTPSQYRQAVQGGLSDSAMASVSSHEAGSRDAAGQSYKSSWAWVMSGSEKGLTSDAGWGCMLRTGQSMLVNALIHLHLGRDWRRPESIPQGDSPADSEAAFDYATYVQLISWFLDDPSPTCPFSVHRMALVGKQLGKEIGEWFGPSTAAGAIKSLTNNFAPCGLAVAVASDGIVFQSQVYEASQQSFEGWDDIPGMMPLHQPIQRNGRWGQKAVLVLAGIRLGLDGVNPIYYESLKSLFTFPQSVGIAGGRPSSSYYFVGTQANSLYYLDPHFTRPAVPLRSTSAGGEDSEQPRTASIRGEVDALLGAFDPSELSTFHCEKVKRMQISGMDPSMLLGFMCKDEEDWLDLIQRVDKLPHKIFSIQDEPPRWGMDGEDVGMESLSEAGFDFEDGSTTSRPSSIEQEAVRVVGGNDLGSDEEDYGEIKTSSQPLSVSTPATAVASLTQTPLAPDRINWSAHQEDVASSAMVDSFATLGVSAPSTPTTVFSGGAVQHRSRTVSTALTVRGLEDEVDEDVPGDQEEKPADVGGSFQDITRPSTSQVETTERESGGKEEQAVWILSTVEDSFETPADDSKSSERVLVESKGATRN